MTKPWSPQDYDAWYETPLGRLSDNLEKELIFSMVDAKPGEAVLDVGCGTGNYTIELAKMGLKAAGIDSSEDMLAWAEEKARREGLEITFQTADAMNIPYPASSFELIISIGLLCFLKEPEKALAEMHRVLKPGGRLVIGTLNRWSPWAMFRRIKGLFRDTIYNRAQFLSPAELDELILKAGFKVREIKTCLFFFPINNRLYLKLAAPFEKLDGVIISRTGAFLAVSAVE